MAVITAASSFIYSLFRLPGGYGGFARLHCRWQQLLRRTLVHL